MKFSLILLIAAADARHHQHSANSLSQQRKYWDKGDQNWDTVEKHAGYFSDLKKGIPILPEESYEEAEKKRLAAIQQSHDRMVKGRYSVINDDTGTKFVDYPEGRGFPPGYERNLENWART